MASQADPFKTQIVSGNTKVKSKRVRTAIEACINNFNKLAKDIISAHSNVSFVSKKVVNLMRGVADISCLQRLQMY